MRSNDAKSFIRGTYVGFQMWLFLVQCASSMLVYDLLVPLAILQCGRSCSCAFKFSVKERWSHRGSSSINCYATHLTTSHLRIRWIEQCKVVSPSCLLILHTEACVFGYGLCVMLHCWNLPYKIQMLLHYFVAVDRVLESWHLAEVQSSGACFYRYNFLHMKCLNPQI